MVDKPHQYSDPHRYKPCRCMVCAECYYDSAAHRCVAGGPFSGYARVDYNLLAPAVKPR